MRSSVPSSGRLTMKPQATSEELQAHIRQARHDLDTHSQEMFKQGVPEFNWRNIVAKHPLLALGTAATAGFLLAPRRCCCRHADAGTAPPAMESAAPPSAASRLMATFLSAATAIVARRGCEPRRGAHHAMVELVRRPAGGRTQYAIAGAAGNVQWSREMIRARQTTGRPIREAWVARAAA